MRLIVSFISVFSRVAICCQPITTATKGCVGTLGAGATPNLLLRSRPTITRFLPQGTLPPGWGFVRITASAAGKILSSKTRNVRCRLANALRIAATTLYRSRSALGDYFRRLRASSVPRQPSPPPLTNWLASSLPCFVTAALSTPSCWEPSTKNIFAAVKTPCANTPLLSALNSFPSKTLLIQFLRSKSGGVGRGKGKRNWRECVAVSDKRSAV